MSIPVPPRGGATPAGAASPLDGATPARADGPTPVPAHHPHGWWRRNGIALGAAAVFATALAGFLWWDGWNSFYGYGARPTTPVVAQADGTVTLSGTAFGPIKTGVATDTGGMNLPAGTTFRIAIIDVDPQQRVPVEGAGEGGFVSCTAPVLVQQSTGRTWSPLRAEVGVPYSGDEPETCDPLAEGPYKLVVGFVVPDDVEGPFWVDVDPVGDGRFARFAVDS